MDVERALDIVNAAVFAYCGRQLSDVETAIFEGTWQNWTYEQIAETSGYSSSYIRQDIGVKLWKLLSQALGEPVSKTNIRSILEQRAVDSQAQNQPASRGQEAEIFEPPRSPLSFSSCQADWGEAVDTSVFYGRNEELNLLKQWVLEDGCRLVAILGMGGIGKSTLSVKLAQSLAPAPPFQFIIWRSLRNAPLLKTLLSDLIRFLSTQQETEISLSRLAYWLRQSRCLIILDNVESILQSGDRAGQYCSGYERYGDLFRLVGETLHQSCLIFTSREKPAEIASMEGADLFVRSLPLSGSIETARQLIQANQLIGTDEQQLQLCQLYGCNPLALKLVSTSIRELFDSNIQPFLAENIAVFNGIRKLLSQHVDRLSPLEQAVMYWLAINREGTTISDLMEDILPKISRQELLDAIKSLNWRSLIEKTSSTDEKKLISYTQQPVVMEYMTDRLVEQLCREITQKQDQKDTENHSSGVAESSSLFQTHALLKTTAKEYIRDTQTRLILQPIANKLRSSFSIRQTLEQQLQTLLNQIRSSPFAISSYATGNLINLCQHMQIDLTGYDFSRLKIWHANLQTNHLHQVNFAYAHFAKAVFIQTFGYVLSVDISPQGQVLATGDGNGQIRLWRMADGQPLLILQEGCTSWVWSVAFSPDGQTLASGSVDQTIKLWDVKTGQWLRTLQGHSNWVRSVAWSPDGTLLASGSTDRTIRLWNTQTWECQAILFDPSDQQDAVWSVAFSPNGQWLASGHNNHIIRVWDVQTKQCIRILTGHKNWIRSIGFSPDGQCLASGSDDCTVKLWDTQTGACLNTLQAHTSAVWSVQWHPNGRTLASASHDQTVRLWNRSNGECLKILDGHTNWVWDVAWSPDGKVLASVAHDQSIKLWDGQTGSCLRTVQGYTKVAMRIAWSPDGQYLAGGYDDHAVRLWNPQAGACLSTLEGHTRVVWGVAWSPDGQSLASSCDDYTVRLWHPSTGHCYKILQHTHWVWSVAWHPDGKRLATGTQDYTILLWDVNTGACLKTLHGHSDSIWWVVWNANGDRLASACDDGTIRIWNPEEDECLRVLQHECSVRQVAWNPDGKTIASGSADPIVRIWDSVSGTKLQDLQGHNHAVWCVAWSPNGTHLASGGDDQTVKLWNVSTGKCTQTLQGHSSQVWSVAWSPDGRLLASSSADRTIRLWDIETGRCLNTLRAERPYEHMNIMGVTGLTEVQKASLKALGAIEQD